MRCRQFTTFRVDGEPILKAWELPVTSEADEPQHLESGVINIYPKIEYQTIEGFGGAMTETSACLLSEMDEATRREALEAFFGKNGNHFRFLRTSMDSCDYSLTEYQAVEDPIADPDFTTFTLKRDWKYIIPMMKEAIRVNDQAGNEPISVLLSPWSPPYQWKTPPERPKNDAAVYGALGMADETDYTKPSRNHGGKLLHKYYGAWAKYLAKYVRAYLREGIPVTMMTMQNESIAATNWDSCVWTAEEQKDFLVHNLWPTFVEEGLAGKVGIYIWDHNKERVLEWSLDMIDRDTAPMIAGIAFHWYSGDHFEAVRMTHEQFPDKELMMSECCGLHKPGQSSFFDMLPFMTKTKTPEHAEEEDAVQYAHDIIGNLNAGMNRWIDWNLLVDPEGGPRHVPGGFTACMIADGGSFRKNMTYYYTGNISRFILPGAKRIGFSRCDDHAEITAAKNTDGSVVVVCLNNSEKDRFYAIRMNGQVIRIELPAHTISTLVITEE